MAAQWYSFNGGDPAITSNYSPIGSTPPTCSGATQQLCAIFTDNVGSNPNLNLVALEMVQALQSQTNTTNVKLKKR